MLEFIGELHDDLGLFGEGQVSIVEFGEEWEGSIELLHSPDHPYFELKQGGEVRGPIKIDHVERDGEKYHAHFVGQGILGRLS